MDGERPDEARGNPEDGPELSPEIEEALGDLGPNEEEVATEIEQYDETAAADAGPEVPVGTVPQVAAGDEKFVATDGAVLGRDVHPLSRRTDSSLCPLPGEQRLAGMVTPTGC